MQRAAELVASVVVDGVIVGVAQYLDERLPQPVCRIAQQIQSSGDGESIAVDELGRRQSTGRDATQSECLTDLAS